MGSSTSTADTTQLKNSLASLQSTVNGLSSKVNNFQAASVDYTQLGSSLVNTSDNLNKITSGIINSPDKLASALTPGLIANTPFVNSINQSISKNTDFTKSVSNLITSDATFKAILKGDKGEPGNIGDYTALKSNLYGSTLTGAKNPATMWCADGDLCNIPRGNKGIDWGYGGSKIYDDNQLNISSDDNIYFNTRNRRMEIRNDGVYITQDGLRALDDNDWFRLVGSRANGTAVYNGMSINDGGGLSVGSWERMPQGDLKVTGKLHTAGYFGPYLMRFYDNNNKCGDVGQNGGLGLMDCNGGNTWQQFYYNPMTGNLYNVQKNQCLDVGDNNWRWVDCNNHQNQRFWKKEHIMQWKNGDCIDIGNGNHHAGCDGNNNNQKFVFDYVG
jgi:hypothetical protein